MTNQLFPFHRAMWFTVILDKQLEFTQAPVNISPAHKFPLRSTAKVLTLLSNPLPTPDQLFPSHSAILLVGCPVLQFEVANLI